MATTEANFALFTGIHDRHSLVTEAAGTWAEDPNHQLIVTTRSSGAAEFVAGINDTDKFGGRIHLIPHVDWSEDGATDIVGNALIKLLGPGGDSNNRHLAGIVNGVASAPSTGLRYPANEVVPADCLDTVNASAVSLKRQVTAALPHLAEGSGVVSYAYGQHKQPTPNYGVMGLGKAALAEMQAWLAVDLARPKPATEKKLATPTVRFAEIATGFMPNSRSSAVIVRMQRGDVNEVSGRMVETAPLEGTPEDQVAAAAIMAVRFMTGPEHRHSTGVRFEINDGLNLIGPVALLG